MRFLTNSYIRALFLIGMGIYFIVEHELRERPQSSEDLIDLSGTINSYSFEDNTGWRKNGRRYYISLDDYTNKFQISANYLRFFDKAKFERNVEKGNRVKISIPEYQKHLIGTEEVILINSLTVNGFRYLSKQESIQFEKASAESNSDYILATVFISVGIMVFIFHDRLKKSY